MAKELNATCSVCGKKYHICWTCSESRIAPWRTIVDTVDHYKIYMVISDYTNGYKDKKETKKLLESLDLSELKTFDKSYRKIIIELINYEDNVVKPNLNKVNRK